jgi:Gpi18-like mannosyltransferase
MYKSEYYLPRFTLLFISSEKGSLLWKKFNVDLLLVLLSVLVQIPLALFLGHYYDERTFMATGYLVGSNLNPYQQFEITGIFAHPLLQGAIPRFGYPPPWALMLGIAFQLSYRILQNEFLYNFAIKVPLILGNICLAFLVKHVILEWYSSKKKAQFAFVFLLFNPFTLLTTSAWGQFDTVVALLCVASLYLLTKGRKGLCALTFALAVSAKPIALPLLGLPLFFNESKKWRGNLRYLIILALMIFVFAALPFFIFGWQLSLSPDEWNAHFKAAGGLTLFGLTEILQNTQFLPSSLELLGFLWLPALFIGYYAIYRNPPTSQNEMVQKAIILILVFFLTRSWLSEPNINLVLPLMLIAIGNDKMSFRNFHFAWTIPFIFMFLNYSIPALFFLPYPNVISVLAELDGQIRTVRLIGRFLVVVLWCIFAWSFLAKMFHSKTSKDSS